MPARKHEDKQSHDKIYKSTEVCYTFLYHSMAESKLIGQWSCICFVLQHGFDSNYGYKMSGGFI